MDVSLNYFAYETLTKFDILDDSQLDSPAITAKIELILSFGKLSVIEVCFLELSLSLAKSCQYPIFPIDFTCETAN